MNGLEILLLGIILLFPVIDLINERFKSENKITEYVKIAFFLWIPTLLMLQLQSSDVLSVSSFNFELNKRWPNISLISLLVLAILYLLALIKTIRRNPVLRDEINKKFEGFRDLMPESKSQVMVFTLVVSVSAGVCEELLIRGYLYNLIYAKYGMAPAILMSSVVFGLWHLYLGWKEVIRTGIMGIIFCGIYIFTGNLLLPILIHIFIDVYSGLLSYFAFEKPEDENG